MDGISDAAAPPALAVGQRVDHFAVVRLLGRGGMGEVYLARDTRLGRKVALKVVHADRERPRSPHPLGRSPGPLPADGDREGEEESR